VDQAPCGPGGVFGPIKHPCEVSQGAEIASGECGADDKVISICEQRRSVADPERSLPCADQRRVIDPFPHTCSVLTKRNGEDKFGSGHMMRIG
jgi:hypothetical protein